MDHAKFDTIIATVDGTRGELRLNRPDKLNPLSSHTLHEIELAARCDLRVAAESARFSIPEVDLGIPLAWGGIPRLVREIGPALTKKLVMTCRPFDAAEAKAAGFLNRVVPDAELDSAVDELVKQLLQKPKLALLETKAHVNAVTESMVGTGRSWADADGLYAGLRDEEGHASAKAYVERLQQKR